MKTILLFSTLLFTCLKTFSGPNGAPFTAGSPINGDPSGQGALAQQQQIYAQDLAQKQYLQAQRQAEYAEQLSSLNGLRDHLETLKSPNGGGLFRVVNGETNYIYGLGWEEIDGKVLQTHPDGILVTGRGEGLDCFIEGYPFQTVDDQQLPFCSAKEDGVYSYTATSGGLRTVRKYVYGKIAVPSPELLQKQIDIAQYEIANHPLVLKAKADALARQKQLAANKSAKERALKSNQEQADNGDPIGLLRMGERYRDGDGVPKDLTRAKDYLTKAAAAGEPSAEDELKNLPAD